MEVVTKIPKYLWAPIIAYNLPRWKIAWNIEESGGYRASKSSLSRGVVPSIIGR